MIISNLISFVKGFSCGISLIHGTAPKREWVGRGWEVTGTRTVLYSTPSKGFTLGDYVGKVGVKAEAPKGDDTPAVESPSMQARRLNWATSPVPEAKPVVKAVVKAKAEPAKPREVRVVGGVTPEVTAWLASKGCVPATTSLGLTMRDGRQVRATGYADGNAKAVVFTTPHDRQMGEVVEADVAVFFCGDSRPKALPSTPLLVKWKDSGKSCPVPGEWRQVAAGVWRFAEEWQGAGLDDLSSTPMPYGEMRIFPRPWGSEAHIDPWVQADTTVPVLGFASETLGQRLEKTWEGWADALDTLDRQWEDAGEEAEGVVVPVAGVPFGMLKLDFLSFNLPTMYGALRQRCRKFMKLHKHECGYKLADAATEAGTYVGVPEVREFERTCSGHWTDRDEFVSTGCLEGHMVRTQVDREFRQLLRCEDRMGRRLEPRKAKRLAEAAQRLADRLALGGLSEKAKEKAVRNYEVQTGALPEAHVEYADDRPIDGMVEYRAGGQVDRLTDARSQADYEQDVEAELGLMEADEDEGNFEVEDDFELMELKDNVIAWQDEMEDILRGEVAFTGHLRGPAANDPHAHWYGALRTIDKLGRIATRARTPGEDTEEGSYPQQVRAEFDSACQAVRESQRFLAATGATKTGGKVKLWEGGNLPTTEWFGRWDGRLEDTARGYCISKVTEEGTLKSHLEEARKAARQAVADLESGAEAEHCRLAFLKEGLVAHPQLGKWVAKVEPAFIAGLKDSDPELWLSLPASARKVPADRKVTPAAKRKAEAAIVEWLADRKEADAVARQEVRLTRSIVKAVEEAVARHREADAKAKAKDEARARRLAVIRQYKGVAN